MSEARAFLAAVEGLAEAAYVTAEELQEVGFGYMAARLEEALRVLAAAPKPVVRKGRSS